MKIKNHLCLFLILLMNAWSFCQIESLRQYAATETYSEDTLLRNIPNKRAMIVIAHDDDMCAMAGTVSQLNQRGWEIAVMSFGKTPERNAAQVKACSSILDTVLFVHMTDQQYRNDLDGKILPYVAIPKETFQEVFNTAEVEAEYIKAIQHFQPSVIFTLDNEMGGYGHPEHVFVSQLVLDLANAGKIAPKYIYQSVFTDHMEKTIMQRHAMRLKSWGLPDDEWDNAKKTYKVEGMPEPNVQFNIRSEAKLKMDYLRSYEKRERKVLGFFIPEFEDYPAEKYFEIFDREFFRIVKIK